MKREELRNRYIRETCSKNSRALRRLAESNSDDSIYIEELANDIEREVDAMLNDNKVTIGFKRLSDDAILPTKAHPTDSGFDLYASDDVIIEPGETVIVPTGIAVELPPGYEAQIRPRSGVTAKTKLRVQLGTIDNGYRGELGVIVDNIFPLIYESNGDVAMTDVVVSINGHNDDESFAKTHCFPSGTHYIPNGTRIAQLVIQRLPETEAVEIDEFSEDSERGAGGFGSTGV